MSFQYKTNKDLNHTNILALYSDAGWTSYTKDMSKLMRGIDNSLDVISAWDGDKLIGLIRTIGDKETIIYIQDILVLKAYKRQGIGRQLMKYILEKYQDVRQIILLADSEPEQKYFYESMGMEDGNISNLKTYRKI